MRFFSSSGFRSREKIVDFSFRASMLISGWYVAAWAFRLIWLFLDFYSFRISGLVDFRFTNDFFWEFWAVWICVRFLGVIVPRSRPLLFSFFTASLEPTILVGWQTPFIFKFWSFSKNPLRSFYEFLALPPLLGESEVCYVMKSLGCFFLLFERTLNSLDFSHFPKFFWRAFDPTKLFATTLYVFYLESDEALEYWPYRNLFPSSVVSWEVLLRLEFIEY